MLTKFYKLISALFRIIRKPYLLNLIINSEEIQKEYVIKNHNIPKGLPVIDCSLIFPEEIIVEPYAYLNGSCIPTDIALLKSLALKIKASTYFEIGTWRGESIANVASAVKDCYTLNLSDNELLAMDLPEEYAKLHGFFSKNLKNVTHLFGNSLSFDFSDYFGKFDLVFIDGDHHYASVRKDTETAFKLIKNENSIIVWHDYAREPQTIRWEVFAGVLDGCPIEKRDKLFHVSNTLCAIYLKHNLKTTVLNMFDKPDKYFKITLTPVKL